MTGSSKAIRPWRPSNSATVSPYGGTRLALQQGEINFYSESPPSYRSVVHPGIVKEGLAIPVWHDPEGERDALIASKQVSDLGIVPFHEFYRSIKGVPPSGTLWDAFHTIRTISGSMLRIVALPPGGGTRDC